MKRLRIFLEVFFLCAVAFSFLFLISAPVTKQGSLTGFVAHDTYPSFAHPQSRAVLPDDFSSLTLSDTLVYARAYVSLGGQPAWSEISLQGKAAYSASSDWLLGTGSWLSLPSFPADNESYILFYSCTLISVQDSYPASSWDCHGVGENAWQLVVVH